MNALPVKVHQAWLHREGPAVLATVDKEMKPNIIYVGEIQYDSNEGFVVADNYFCKTRDNIKNGSTGSILFITMDKKSFQVKGSIAYHTKGPVFESMKAWHNPKLPGVAAVVLHVEEVFCGAEKLL
jgi:predicted pyridoxine 5'-phosphate oxidase superfamily flavin-nucleotide-binding protein